MKGFGTNQGVSARKFQEPGEGSYERTPRLWAMVVAVLAALLLSVTQAVSQHPCSDMVPPLSFTKDRQAGSIAADRTMSTAIGVFDPAPAAGKP
jgi:hypothetical protein